MKNSTYGQEWAKELQGEAGATRKCLERIPFSTFEYKPHEKSMAMGYLALLVAEIPKWISTMVEKGEIDYGTFTHLPLDQNANLAAHFDENLAGAIRVLEAMPDETAIKPFTLKFNGTVLFSMPLKDSIISTINHWVHHRGQLTVYMRLNDIAVPSIYGPSADDKAF